MCGITWRQSNILSEYHVQTHFLENLFFNYGSSWYCYTEYYFNEFFWICWDLREIRLMLRFMLFPSESLFSDLFGLYILVGVEMIQLGVDQFFNRNFLKQPSSLFISWIKYHNFQLNFYLGWLLNHNFPYSIWIWAVKPDNISKIW